MIYSTTVEKWLDFELEIKYDDDATLKMLTNYIETFELVDKKERYKVVPELVRYDLKEGSIILKITPFYCEYLS